MRQSPPVLIMKKEVDRALSSNSIVIPPARTGSERITSMFPVLKLAVTRGMSQLFLWMRWPMLEVMMRFNEVSIELMPARCKDRMTNSIPESSETGGERTHPQKSYTLSSTAMLARSAESVSI